MSTSEKIKAFLAISRAKIQLGTPPHPLLGLILGASAFGDVVSTPALLYLALYLLLITFACNVNCLYDIDIDKKYKKYMSDAVETLGKGTVKSFILLESVAIVLLTFYLFINGYIITSVLALSGMMFGYIYSAEPIRVKKRGIFSPFPVLIGLYTLPVLGGWFIFHGNLSLYIIVFSIGYALINEGITLVNTCEDYDEDKSEDITTWAHLFDLRKTMKIAYVFTIGGGIIAVIGVFLKPILLGWSFYNMYSSVIFVSMGVLNTAIILLIGEKIIVSSEKDDLKSSCKKAAKNMPKWFITTRYPLLLMSLLILL